LFHCYFKSITVSKFDPGCRRTLRWKKTLPWELLCLKKNNQELLQKGFHCGKSKTINTQIAELNILYCSPLFFRRTLTADILYPAALAGAHLVTLTQITAIRVLTNSTWRQCIQTPSLSCHSAKSFHFLEVEIGLRIDLDNDISARSLLA